MLHQRSMTPSHAPLATLPIGIFDSGLGGLSVLKELVDALPEEDFLYLGDIARLPYGTKSHDVVARYARTCADLLKSRGIKALVIACNTATAMALSDLQAGEAMPVFGVIEPGVKTSVGLSRRGKVLVLATASTVKSGAYLAEFKKQAPHLVVDQVSCPLLVPLVEQGWFEGEITEKIVRTYLKDVRTADYDSILLGCTHYPLLSKAIHAVVGAETPLVHGAKVLAEELKAALSANGLRQAKSHSGNTTFLATDSITSDLPILTALFPSLPHFQLVDLPS